MARNEIIVIATGILIALIGLFVVALVNMDRMPRGRRILQKLGML